MGKMIKPDIQIVGDAKAALKTLLPHIQGKLDTDEWLTKLEGYKKKFPLSYRKQGGLRMQQVIDELYQLTEGKAIVAGFDVFEQPIEAKKRTGYLPETPPLYPDMTVREYLTFAAKIKMRTKASAAERKARVDEVMKKTFVADMANRHCGKL